MHYEEKLVDQIKVNDKRFWNYTRHFTKSSSINSDLTFEEKKFSDDQNKANIKKKNFISILTNESELQHSLPTLYTNVKCTLYNLEILPTSGPDLLNVNVLRNCLDFDIP